LFPGGIVDLLDQFELGGKMLDVQVSQVNLGLLSDPFTHSLHHLGDSIVVYPVTVEVLGFDKAATFYQPRVVREVVGHHDERAGIKPFSENSHLLIGVEVHGAKNQFHSLFPVKVAGSVEESPGHLGIIDTIEESEEPCHLFLEFDIIPVDVSADSAKEFSPVRKGKGVFHLCMIKERILTGIKEVFSFVEKVGNVIFRLGIEA
jgi:hypothetical protein